MTKFRENFLFASLMASITLTALWLPMATAAKSRLFRSLSDTKSTGLAIQELPITDPALCQVHLPKTGSKYMYV
jgi:hypothetical protein